MKYSLPKSVFSSPVINVESTSENLRKIREQHKITVAQLQKIFNMENPQSIYVWENSRKKTLPCLDNLVVLAKLYEVSIDELIILKSEKNYEMAVCEPMVLFGIKKENFDFIRRNSTPESIRALEDFSKTSFRL